ncbi:hypothetical protein [Pseudomonas sp. AKS31]|uniref:hypothetical protein n=1 Tax=Pseudomonas sp. AKS31 TaxID=2949091 RepID=UPI00202A887D|nr:hypothetical protein [Pseudomonas sp. AKS31]MCL9802143.1 hypothetical protein [Pseudomonas sp. AKS31]
MDESTDDSRPFLEGMPEQGMLFASSDLGAAHDYRMQQQRAFGADDLSRWRSLSSQVPDLMKFLQRQFRGFPLEGVEAEIIDNLSLPVGPFDEPLLHAGIDDDRQQIERAAIELGYSLHSGVSAGVLHGPGMDAMQQRVMLTHASVLLVNIHLNTALHRLAKLLARSTPVDTAGKALWEYANIRDTIKADQALQTDWTHFFMDYSLDSAQPGIGRAIPVSGLHQMCLLGDFSEAMSWFVMGHEFGHHILQHTLDGEASADGESAEVTQGKEVEADVVGARLSAYLGEHNLRGLNYMAKTNIGAVLVLTTLDCFKRGRHLMLTGTQDGFRKDDAHPPLQKRLQSVLSATCGSYPDADPERIAWFNTLRDQQKIAHDVIELIWRKSSPLLKKAFDDGMRGKTKLDTGWLP